MGVGGYTISHSDFSKCIEMLTGAAGIQGNAFDNGRVSGMIAMMAAISKSYMSLPEALAKELGDFNGR